MARLKKQRRALYARGWRPRPSAERQPYRHPVPVLEPRIAAERAVAAVRPNSVRRRAISIYRWANEQAPDLLAWQRREGILALARLPWQRPLYTLPASGQCVAGLVRHLLMRYPLNAIWIQPFQWDGGRDARTRDILTRLAALLGRGGGLHQAWQAGLLPPSFTRRMFHQLLTSDPATPLVLAIRQAQVGALGGQPWLASELCRTALGALQQREDLWLRRIAWLCRSGVEAEQVPEIVAFLHAVPARLRGRSASSLAREAQRWRIVQQVGHHDPRPFPPCGFGDASPDCDDPSWTFHELRSPRALVREGRALRHCVGGYALRVRRGTSSIWSLRRDGERVLTVEVFQRQRAIRQVRGLANRSPSEPECRIIEAWARANGLAIASI